MASVEGNSRQCIYCRNWYNKQMMTRNVVHKGWACANWKACQARLDRMTTLRRPEAGDPRDAWVGELYRACTKYAEPGEKSKIWRLFHDVAGSGYVGDPESK